jgi:hypothetical protein
MSMTRKFLTKAWFVPIAMMTKTIASMISTVPLVIATSHSCVVGTSEHLQTRRLDPRASTGWPQASRRLRPAW